MEVQDLERRLRKNGLKSSTKGVYFTYFHRLKDTQQVDQNTLVGLEFYALTKELFDVKTLEDSRVWVNRFTDWIIEHKRFLSEITYDENGNSRPKHERLIKAEKSILRLLNEKHISNIPFSSIFVI